MASVAARGQDPGRLVGEVCATNTVGAIVGALAGSLILVGSMGTHGAQRLVIGVADRLGDADVRADDGVAAERPGERGECDKQANV